MERNLVIFGPAHVGKSTLAGYMHAKLEEDFSLTDFVSKVRKALGNLYDDSLKFAYILDERKDERTGRPKSKRGKLGTSRYMHADRIRIKGQEVTVIDTPGAQHKYRERIKGIYFGDVGVFMIELSKLAGDFLEFGTLRDFFTPLFVWRNLEDKIRKLVIVVSKMDELDFSKKEFDEARAIIGKVCDDEAIRITPIAIDVEKEKEHNVFTKSEKMAWYLGPTLIGRLREIYKKTPDSEIEKPLFVHVNRLYDKKWAGVVLEGKILQGTLKKGSMIKIAPVKYQNKELVNILAEVKNIKFKRGELTEIAETGSLMGINLHNMTMGGRRIDKESFDAIETSCVISPGTALLNGNVLRFRISSDAVERFHILETVMILWFGKFVSSQVVHKTNLEDHGVITLEMFGRGGSLPVDSSGKFFFDHFLLKRENEFEPAFLEKFGIPRTLTLFLKDTSTRKEQVQKYFERFKYEMGAKNVTFDCGKSLIGLVSRIKEFDERFLEEPEDILSDIDVEIKESKEE